VAPEIPTMRRFISLPAVQSLSALGAAPRSVKSSPSNIFDSSPTEKRIIGSRLAPITDRQATWLLRRVAVVLPVCEDLLLQRLGVSRGERGDLGQGPSKRLGVHQAVVEGLPAPAGKFLRRVKVGDPEAEFRLREQDFARTRMTPGRKRPHDLGKVGRVNVVTHDQDLGELPTRM